MFTLTVIKDRVRIKPADFDKSIDQALTDQLNAKYANRVIPNIGLCICLFDIVERSEGYIYHSDGCSYINVTVQLVIFKPFEGEVLVGRIRSSSAQGIYVTLDFFDDILIPPELMQEGTEFDVNEQLWAWQWEDNVMHMDLDEPIRFRVVGDAFTEASPTTNAAASNARRVSTGTAAAAMVEDGLDAATATAGKIPPYAITGMIQGSGLGLLSWWGSA